MLVQQNANARGAETKAPLGDTQTAETSGAGTKAKRSMTVEQKAKLQAGRVAKIEARKLVLQAVKDAWAGKAMPEALAAAVKLLEAEPVVTTSAGFNLPPVIERLFGSPPIVGAKVTHREAYSKTHASAYDLRSRFKEWEKAGTSKIEETAAPEGSSWEEVDELAYFTLVEYTPKASK